MTAVVDAIGARVVVALEGLSREEWLKVRRRGLGGSDAAAVCGISPWSSALEVWLDKRGELRDQEETEAMEWGRRLEGVVAVKFSEAVDMELIQPENLFQHLKHDFMFGNPDRFALCPTRGLGIYEGKTCRAELGYMWEDGPAEHALVQANHYLGVTGLDWAGIAVLIGGQRFLFFVVERDEGLIDLLVELEGAFWEKVQAAEMPALVAADNAALSELYRRSRPGSETMLPPGAIDVVARREMHRRAELAAKKAKEQAEVDLKSMLGLDEIGLDASGRTIVTWKASAPDSFEEKQFKADHPDLAAEYTRPSPRRTFRIPGRVSKELAEWQARNS